MNIRFLHCADIHLGYRQYNHEERYLDFGRAWDAVVAQALSERVDFFILAGDLFHHRSVDPRTLSQAVAGLERLRTAGIPVLAVEGNHERAYHNERMGWMQFLCAQGLLILLDATFPPEGLPVLEPWDPERRCGAYIEAAPGLRVYGLRYFGAGTGLALERYARAIAETARPTPGYTIFMAHAGVKGVLDDKAGGLSLAEWEPLRPYVDYLALGHFHKPFALDEWIFNPGSSEANASNEAAWEPRGYLLVTLESDAGGVRRQTRQGTIPKRPFRHYSFSVAAASTPAQLLEQLGAEMVRWAAALRRELGHYHSGDARQPVVELYLTGTLPFGRSALDIRAVEALLEEAFQPLVGLVKDFTQAADVLIETGETMTRQTLEKHVLSSLFSRDPSLAPQSEAWAAVALELKRMAIGAMPATEIADQLGQLLAGMEEEEE